MVFISSLRIGNAFPLHHRERQFFSQSSVEDFLAAQKVDP